LNLKYSWAIAETTNLFFYEQLKAGKKWLMMLPMHKNKLNKIEVA